MSLSSLLTRTASMFRSQVRPVSEESPLFREERITDEWFRSHFVYAPDIVNEWLGKGIDVSKSRILDFGCGDGIMDLGVALRHKAREVIGADIHESSGFLAATAKEQLGLEALPGNLKFARIEPGESLASKGPIDAVFSWSVFEHIERSLLPGILADIFASLPPRGVFFLQIEPLYFSPFGAHLSGLVPDPWVHLLCSDAELQERIERRQPEDMLDEHKNKTFEVCSFVDFKKYLQREYASLNKLTSSELVGMVEAAGFRVEESWDSHLSIRIPPELLQKYPREDLTRNEIRLLLRKP